MSAIEIAAIIIFIIASLYFLIWPGIWWLNLIALVLLSGSTIAYSIVYFNAMPNREFFELFSQLAWGWYVLTALVELGSWMALVVGNAMLSENIYDGAGMIIGHKVITPVVLLLNVVATVIIVGAIYSCFV